MQCYWNNYPWACDHPRCAAYLLCDIIFDAPGPACYDNTAKASTWLWAGCGVWSSHLREQEHILYCTVHTVTWQPVLAHRSSQTMILCDVRTETAEGLNPVVKNVTLHYLFLIISHFYLLLFSRKTCVSHTPLHNIYDQDETLIKSTLVLI